MEIALIQINLYPLLNLRITYKGHSPEPYTTKTDAQSHMYTEIKFNQVQSRSFSHIFFVRWLFEGTVCG